MLINSPSYLYFFKLKFKKPVMIEYAYLRRIASKRIALLILFLVFSVVNVFSQGITGKIIDKNSEPIHGASILLQTTDSTIIDTTISNSDGSFTLTDTDKPFLLIVQHIGYKVSHTKYNTNNVGNIMLIEDHIQLDELVVKGNKPHVKVEQGKLIYDTKKLTENKIVNNAWDLLNKLPGVSIHGKSVSLIGSQNVTVLVNGNPTGQSAEELYSKLNAMPVSRIARAEIIYNAPAQYHSNGAVINLVTNWAHRKFKEALALKRYIEGEFTANYINQYFGGGGMNRSFRFAAPKLQFNFSYALNKLKKMEYTEMNSNHSLHDNIYFINQIGKLSSKHWEHDIRSSLDYKFNDQNSINITYSGVFTPSMKIKNHTEDSYRNSINTKKTDATTHNFSLNTKLGIGLSLGAEYTYYALDDFHFLNTSYQYNNNVDKISSTGIQKIDRYAGYADQTHTLKNGWNLGYGASYVYTKNNDTQVYEATEDIGDIINTEGVREEHKADLYLATSKQFNSGLSLNASIKGEYYKIADYNKWSLYPQLSLTYAKNPKHIYQIGLSTDRIYPTYWAMKSSVSFIDAYSVVYGSPNLRPATNYNLNATYTLNQKYIFRAFYTYSKDYFAQIPYQSTEQLALVYQMMNWDYVQTVGVNVILPFKAGNWLESQLTLTGLYTKHKSDDFYDLSFNRDKFDFTSRLDNTFIVNKHLLFELNANFQSQRIQGILDLGNAASLDVAMKWKLYKNKMDIMVYCNDIFNTSAPELTTSYNGQDLLIDRNFYTRTVGVNFIFRFGGFTTKKTKRVDTSRFGH